MRRRSQSGHPPVNTLRSPACGSSRFRLYGPPTRFAFLGSPLSFVRSGDELPNLAGNPVRCEGPAAARQAAPVLFGLGRRKYVPLQSAHNDSNLCRRTTTKAAMRCSRFAGRRAGGQACEFLQQLRKDLELSRSECRHLFPGSLASNRRAIWHDSWGSPAARQSSEWSAPRRLPLGSGSDSTWRQTPFARCMGRLPSWRRPTCLLRALCVVWGCSCLLRRGAAATSRGGHGPDPGAAGQTPGRALSQSEPAAKPAASLRLLGRSSMPKSCMMASRPLPARAGQARVQHIQSGDVRNRGGLLSQRSSSHCAKARPALLTHE